MAKRGGFLHLRGLARSKKGDENFMQETIIFIVLNSVFFAIMLAFVWRSGTGAALQEQVYAKEIALMIDEMRAGTKAYLEMGGAIDFARGKIKELGAKSDEDVIKSIVRLDSAGSAVGVGLTDKGKYMYKYFNGNEIEISAQGKFLVIDAKESAK